MIIILILAYDKSLRWNTVCLFYTCYLQAHQLGLFIPCQSMLATCILPCHNTLAPLCYQNWVPSFATDTPATRIYMIEIPFWSLDAGESVKIARSIDFTLIGLGSHEGTYTNDCWWSLQIQTIAPYLWPVSQYIGTTDTARPNDQGKWTTISMYSS